MAGHQHDPSGVRFLAFLSDHPSLIGSVEILSMREGRKADDEILETMAKTADRTAYVVVTNDREIADGSRRVGVQVLSCGDFLKTIAPPPEEEQKANPPSSGEVDYWMKEFGFEE